MERVPERKFQNPSRRAGPRNARCACLAGSQKGRIFPESVPRLLRGALLIILHSDRRTFPNSDGSVFHDPSLGRLQSCAEPENRDFWQNYSAGKIFPSRKRLMHFFETGNFPADSGTFSWSRDQEQTSKTTPRESSYNGLIFPGLAARDTFSTQGGPIVELHLGHCRCISHRVYCSALSFEKLSQSWSPGTGISPPTQCLGRASAGSQFPLVSANPIQGSHRHIFVTTESGLHIPLVALKLLALKIKLAAF